MMRSFEIASGLFRDFSNHRQADGSTAGIVSYRVNEVRGISAEFARFPVCTNWTAGTAIPIRTTPGFFAAVFPAEETSAVRGCVPCANTDATTKAPTPVAIAQLRIIRISKDCFIKIPLTKVEHARNQAPNHRPFAELVRNLFGTCQPGFSFYLMTRRELTNRLTLRQKNVPSGSEQMLAIRRLTSQQVLTIFMRTVTVASQVEVSF